MIKKIVENITSLKFKLMLQSLSPLALLTIIRNFSFVTTDASRNSLNLEGFIFENRVLLCVLFLCAIWLFFSIWAFVDFSAFKIADKKDGYTIIIDEEKEDASLNFFLTLIIPLLLDDVDSIQGALTFACIVAMLVLLLYKTSLFYANPVLALLGYRIYLFHFEENKELPDKYIGLSRGVTTGEKTIEYKKITARVMYIRERNNERC